MAWCLIKEQADKFKQALREGKINPAVMSEMTSAERRKFLSQYVGEDNAKEVNALFESKLLLKNQKAGMVAWAKKIIGVPSNRRSEMIDRIEKLQEVLDPKDNKFLQDLASTRLKIDVTQKEAKNIADLSKKITELRQKADANGKFATEKDRLEYGATKVALEEYVNELKLQAGKTGIFEDPFTKIKQLPVTIGSIAKSSLASLDNSFFGRQGIKVLMNNKTWGIWAKNFLKSWNDIVTELKGVDALALIRADIYSRPNAMNGKYRAMKLGLEALNEEAYPSSLPEKIPALGRLFKASQSAYNGAALKMRADLADYYIKLAEEAGVNMNDPRQAEPIGTIIGSMTGRGKLGVSEGTAEALNALLFSPKFLVANIDSITAHIFDKKMTPFAKKLAAENWLRMIIMYASIFIVKGLLDPDSVEWDPRSSNFGKMRIFGQWVDITGGMGQIVTLVSRLIPTTHNGELGFWTKSKAGVYKKLGSKEFGSQDAMDVLTTFLEGKLSPAAKTVTTIWRNEDFQGNVPTPTSIAKSLFVPLPAQNIPAIYNSPDSSFALGSIILDLLGFSTNTAVQPNTTTKTIKVDKPTPNKDILDHISLYSEALNQDPEKVFSTMFAGQYVLLEDEVTSKVIMIPADNKVPEDAKRLKVDMTVPEELGGTFARNNIELISTGRFNSFSGVETFMIAAVENKKVTKQRAADLLKLYKAGEITEKELTELYE
jgi:hypothetical protein